MLELCRHKLYRSLNHKMIMKTAEQSFASFEDFYLALNADSNISERLEKYPGMEEQVKESLRKLYDQAQVDEEFREQLKASPRETALNFIRSEMVEYELTDEQLEAVAGGEITRDTSLGYDIGYVIGSAVEWVVDLFD